MYRLMDKDWLQKLQSSNPLRFINILNVVRDAHLLTNYDKLRPLAPSDYYLLYLKRTTHALILSESHIYSFARITVTFFNVY